MRVRFARVRRKEMVSWSSMNFQMVVAKPGRPPPSATLEGDGQFKTSLFEAADKDGISLDLRVVCSSFPLMTEVLKQGHIAAILPNIAEVELPAAKFERIQLKLLKSMDRQYVLCFRQRTLERGEALARQLSAFVQLLQIENPC